MHQYYDQSAVQKPVHSVYLDPQPDAATTTLVEEVPEPIKNVFDAGDDAAQEEKTMGLGPNNEVKMQESTAAVGPPAAHDDKEPAPIPADDRAPVGLDAGALEVTGGAHDEGGWHGGANEDAPKEHEPETPKAPVGAKVDVPVLDLDDEAKRLADEALRGAEEDKAA